MELSLIDKRASNLIRYYMPDDDTIDGLATFFSVFSDTTRIKILSALSISTMCVGDLAAILDINQTTVSHQLKLLKSNGMVKSTRQGKIIFYALSAQDAVNALMNQGAEHLLAKSAIAAAK